MTVLQSKKTARKLIHKINECYLELGRTLVFLRENESYGQFRAFIKDDLKISYRKAMYLVDVALIIDQCEVPVDKISHLGWTKVRIIAKYLPSDVDYWVQMADTHTTIQLAAILKKKTPQSNVRARTFYLSDAECHVLDAWLREYGAVRSGRKMLGKEAALMKIFKEAS